MSPRPSKLKAWAYKDFKIEDLFDLATTKKKFNANDVSLGGIYPYVVRTSENNGIRGFITENECFLNEGNTISLGQDTATIFYQESPYFTGDKIKVLKSKYKLNRQIACYYITCMRKSFAGFAWGVTSFNENVLKNITIHIPVTSAGDIDFAFMESRIREMEESRIREMEAYLKVAGFEHCELTEEERLTLRNFKSHKTKPIVISSIFDIRKGKRLTKDNMIPGPINFIGSTSVNNGITARVSNSSHIHNGNTITVTYNGSVGEAFYQSDSFWASDDVNVLTFKDSLNEMLGLFFCTSLRKSGKKYGYTYKWTKELMGKDKIILPVTSSGSIDYKFMETYIRAIEKLTIQSVKDWRAKEIKATMDIVKDVR